MMVRNNGKISLLATALCLVFVVFPISAQATDYNVPIPYATIQSAINAAGSTDRVVVDDGTYNENLTHKAGVELVSVNGPASTIINANISGSGITISNVGSGPPYTIVDGFTIVQGYAYRGGGILIEGDGSGGSCAPIIKNCIIGRPSG